MSVGLPPSNAAHFGSLLKIGTSPGRLVSPHQGGVTLLSLDSCGA